MSTKFISIVGSAEEGRAYDPPIKDCAAAKKTAELLGEALAAKGYGIIVYAGDFIERDVVRGFVKKARSNATGLIRVLYPSGHGGAEEFPEYEQRKELFDPKVDHSSDWEMSFYGSLPRTDGVVVIGGASSALITGVLAVNYRIPIIALKSCGGSGEKIWKVLATGRGLLTQEEIEAMGQKADAANLKKWVDSLESQADAARIERSRLSGERWVKLAWALLVVWILTVPAGYFLLGGLKAADGIQSFPFLFLLFCAPLVAGASGATVRMLIHDAGSPTGRTVALGATAGAIAGMLYVISHLMTNPQPLNVIILAIAVAFGFIAGLTFDNVFKKLSAVDAVHLEALKKPK